MQIGPYRIREELGRGGNAVVFRARGPRGEDCAIKVLHRQDRVARQRFLREAQVLAELSHPAIVPLRSVGEHEGSLYLAMPYYRGHSLADRIAEEGPLAPGEAVELAQSLADGLAYAHAHGVLHRDLKPDNVLLDRAGNARLTDFGLARRTDPQETRLSKSGAFLGTPGFWAPEQAGGPHEIGPETDVYGLGATLYCMLSGRPPLSGANLVEIMQAVNERAPEPPSQHAPGVDSALDLLCLRCLAKRPADRFPSARALQDALADYARSAAAPSSRGAAGWWVLVVALLLSGGLTLWWGWPGDVPPPHAAPADPPDADPDLRGVIALLDRGAALEALRALDALEPLRSKHGLRLRADALIALGDFDAAYAASDALLEAYPEFSAGYVQRARIDVANRDLDAALRHIEVALDVEQDERDDVELMRAELLATRDGRERAEGAFRALCERSPGFRPAWTSLLWCVGQDAERRLEVLDGALRAFPEDAELLRMRGHAHGYLRRFEEAQRDLEQLRALGVATVEDLTSLAIACSSGHDGQAALEVARLAVGTDPSHAPAWRELGAALNLAGRFSEARHVLAHALATDPRDLRTYAALAEACNAQDDFRWSVRLIDFALSQHDPRRSGLYYLLGRGLLKLGQFEPAEKVLTRALATNPSNPAELRGLRGTARLGLNKDRGACDDLQAALAAGEAEALLWYNLAAAQLNLHEDEAALASLARYRERVEDCEQDVQFLTLERIALAGLRRLDEALEVQRRLCALAPEDPKAHFDLAELCLDLGELEPALAAAERAVELAPQSVEIACLLADVQAKRGELVACTEILSEQIRLHPSMHQLRRLLADRFYQAQHYALAETIFDGYLERVPEDAEAYGRRAACRAEQDDLAGALEDLDRALELDPHELTSLVNRGQLRLHQGRPVEALADLGVFVSRAPRDIKGQLLFAQALDWLGRTAEARARLITCLQADPEHPLAEGLRARIADYTR